MKVCSGLVIDCAVLASASGKAQYLMSTRVMLTACSAHRATVVCFGISEEAGHRTSSMMLHGVRRHGTASCQY